MQVYGLICIATNHKSHKENIKVKRLSLKDFIRRFFFTQDGQSMNKKLIVLLTI